MRVECDEGAIGLGKGLSVSCMSALAQCKPCSGGSVKLRDGSGQGPSGTRRRQGRATAGAAPPLNSLLQSRTRLASASSASRRYSRCIQAHGSPLRPPLTPAAANAAAAPAGPPKWPRISPKTGLEARSLLAEDFMIEVCSCCCWKQSQAIRRGHGSRLPPAGGERLHRAPLASPLPLDMWAAAAHHPMLPPSRPMLHLDPDPRLPHSSGG